jgi:hypothetical protein
VRRAPTIALWELLDDGTVRETRFDERRAESWAYLDDAGNPIDKAIPPELAVAAAEVVMRNRFSWRDREGRPAVRSLGAAPASRVPREAAGSAVPDHLGSAV